MIKDSNIVVDTNIIIDFIREESKFSEFKNEYSGNKFGVSLFNIMEIYSSSNISSDIEKYRGFFKEMNFTLGITDWIDSVEAFEVAKNEKDPEVLRNKMLKYRSIVEVKSFIQLIDYMDLIIKNYFTKKNGSADNLYKSYNLANIIIDNLIVDREEIREIFEQAYIDGDISNKIEEVYLKYMIGIIESFGEIKTENRVDGKLYEDFENNLLENSIKEVYEEIKKKFNEPHQINRLEKVFFTIKKLMISGTKIRNVKNDFIDTIISGPLIYNNFYVCTKDRKFCTSLEENGYKLIDDNGKEYKMYSK